MLTVTCHLCGSRLAVPFDGVFRWIRHHDDGSHTLHSAERGDPPDRVADWRARKDA